MKSRILAYDYITLKLAPLLAHLINLLIQTLKKLLLAPWSQFNNKFVFHCELKECMKQTLNSPAKNDA